MAKKSLTEPSFHQKKPFQSCKIHYVEVGSEEPDFAISTVCDLDLEPASHPIIEVCAHNWLEVGYCHCGAGLLLVEDRFFSFRQGDICFVNGREMHMSRSANESRCHWSYFWLNPGRLLANIPEGMETLLSMRLGGPGFPNIITYQQYPELCRFVLDIVNELKRPSTNHRLIIRGMVCVMIGMLYRILEGVTFPDDDIGRSRQGLERIAPALAYITQRYYLKIKTKSLAAACNMSLTHFRRVFLNIVGMSPMKYLAQVRVRMAATILCETGKNVTETAFSVGFESINTFNRHFREVMGEAPLAWRKNHASK